MIDTALDNPILTVRGLRKFFPLRRGVFSTVQGYVRAVDGVDFSIARGRTLGLVGESGSGKTTVGRTIMKLIPATAGQVVFDEWDVMSLRGLAMRQLRRRMQIIFQDPFSSLNPRMRVGDIVAEPLRVHHTTAPGGIGLRVAQLLERVGLAAAYASRYPHEFSGGQRQRIGIARALASQPEFIVCDEPVSALDVSVRAQILNLLQDLQDELGLSYLFIAHDLAVVEHFADDVAVMYLGRIVEIASKTRIIGSPRHPYTESLLSAVPRIRPQERTQRIRLQGEMPSPINPPSGCPFHPRCPLTRQLAQGLPESQTAAIASEGQSVRIVARCTQEVPELLPTEADASHSHACLLRQ
ncbi:MAG: oligopeptide/dipeptide ABC transporter ATP-binding protein [Planctomycetaceae bacterium]|nr:ATP-binding cassette domain-containing protein [Planctomycetaceae bacterium]